jgi:hypothetical protein
MIVDLVILGISAVFLLQWVDSEIKSVEVKV